MNGLRYTTAVLLTACCVSAGSTAVVTQSSTRPGWLAAPHVAHFTNNGTFPCDGCPDRTASVYAEMSASGVSVTSWTEIRGVPNWRRQVSTWVANNRSRGLRTIGTISNVWFWWEYSTTRIPDDLRRAAVLDPFGNPRVDPFGWFPGDATWYTLLDPRWEEYLLSCLQVLVDGGVDGILIDDAVLMGELWDFRPSLLNDFKAYLATRRSRADLDALASSLGFPSFAEFDYARVWRMRLPVGTTTLTDDLWYRRQSLNIPLVDEYSAFMRMRTHAALERIISRVKERARSRDGRELPVSFNLGNVEPGMATYLDLLDFVDNEFSYSTNENWAAVPTYTPSARATGVAKLMAGVGLLPHVLTNIPGRADIAARGTQNTGLYRRLIADAYAAGGSFYVEERANGIQTSFSSIAPWYRFVADQPQLFRGTPEFVDVAVLQLWEQYDWFPRRSLNGAAALLSDEGWQYDVLFSAEDIQPEFPIRPRLVGLDRLRRYPVVIVPSLAYCVKCGVGVTATHARLLLDYVAAGGLLVVFTTDDQLANVMGRDPDPVAQELYRGLRTSADIARNGQGIIRVREPWPSAYFDTVSRDTAARFTALLEGADVRHPVTVSGSRLAVASVVTRNGGKLNVQLVNYDYDRATDRTNVARGLRLRLADIAPVRATAYAPGTPAVALPIIVEDRAVSVTVPDLDPWIVISFDLATTP